MHGSISIENDSFSRYCDIKTTNAKSVTDTSIWVIENIVCLTLLLSFPAMEFISGHLISLTNPIHRIPG